MIKAGNCPHCNTSYFLWKGEHVCTSASGMIPPPRRYPVGLTLDEIEALRSLLDKAEHALRNGNVSSRVSS